jgi:hypothetical protein
VIDRPKNESVCVTTRGREGMRRGVKQSPTVSVALKLATARLLCNCCCAVLPHLKFICKNSRFTEEHAWVVTVVVVVVVIIMIMT